MSYIMKNYKRIRRRTDYIILTHSRNFIENFYIDPMVIQGRNGYSWGIWQDYFMHDLKKPALPCHYFTEFLDKDYVVYKGLGDIQPSYFIEDLVSAGIVKFEYLNSIIIGVGEDFSINTLDDRLSEQLCDKIICPLLREFKLDFTRVKYIDDCLHDEWEENLKFSTLEYKMTLGKLFDMNQLKLNIDKFKKK